MEITFAECARADIHWWKTSGNVKAIAKISALMEAIQVSPFEGIGKPEPLKHHLAGTWFRRINSEHRMFMKCTRKK